MPIIRYLAYHESLILEQIQLMCDDDIDDIKKHINFLIFFN